MNFLGPYDESVVSGSDDGNFFLWDKSTADLNGIYEGDGEVVNVIEGHPFLPLLAVSGIDTTVKVILRHIYHLTCSLLMEALCPLKDTEPIFETAGCKEHYEGQCTASSNI